MTDAPAPAATPRKEFFAGMRTVVWLDAVGMLVTSCSCLFVALVAERVLPSGPFVKAFSSECLSAAWFCLLAVGLIQWFWLVPAMNKARRGGSPERAKGIFVGGALVLLMTSLCWVTI